MRVLGRAPRLRDRTIPCGRDRSHVDHKGGAMQFHPVRALITRDDDNDSRQEAFHDVPGMIPAEPEVGSRLQVFLDSGKVMRTRDGLYVARCGSERVVVTAHWW